MKTFAFIFARGGSKGLPKKNIKKLLGKPLIGYSIEAAKKIKEISNCFVSTDSNEIAKIAEKFGATVIRRPKKLAKDNSVEWDAWRHAIKWVNNYIGKFDRFISLPATCPLRNIKDIKNCLSALDKKTDFVVSMTHARRNPWFNMVKQVGIDNVDLLINKGKKITRRQEIKKSLDLRTAC